MATDVWNDRNYLLAMMRRGPHDPLAQTAQKQWELLNQREAQEASLGATKANLAEQITSRETGQKLTREQIAQRDKEQADYRDAILAQRAAEDRDRNSARTLASVQSILEAYPGPEGQKRAQAVLNQYLTGQGITTPTAAPDKVTTDAQKFAASQGKPVVAPATPAVTTTGAPAARPTAEAPTTGAINFAPSGTVAPTGPTGTVPATATPVRPPEGLTLGEMLKSAPPGMQLVNAGGGGYIYAAKPTVLQRPSELPEVRPPGTVGYINGRPAGEVIAEGALRTGVIPQSESGRTALTSRLSQEGLPFYTKTTEPTGAAAAETPVTPPGTPAPATSPSAPFGQPWKVTSEEAAQNRAAISGFLGRFINLPGAHQAEVEQKRTMAGFLPPPSPLGPETGGMNFADITKPSANLAAGPTPPAGPSVPGGTPNIPAAMQQADLGLEELRKRMAAQQQQQ